MAGHQRSGRLRLGHDFRSRELAVSWSFDCRASGALGQIESPSDLALVSYHPLGTCRMGKDPKTSVVDTDHAAHDVPGLFIVDASTVRGPIGVNPQLTIMATATRAAERIAARIT